MRKHSQRHGDHTGKLDWPQPQIARLADSRPMQSYQHDRSHGTGTYKGLSLPGNIRYFSDDVQDTMDKIRSIYERERSPDISLHAEVLAELERVPASRDRFFCVDSPHEAVDQGVAQERGGLAVAALILRRHPCSGSAWCKSGARHPAVRWGRWLALPSRPSDSGDALHSAVTGAPRARRPGFAGPVRGATRRRAPP